MRASLTMDSGKIFLSKCVSILIVVHGGQLFTMASRGRGAKINKVLAI